MSSPTPVPARRFPLTVLATAAAVLLLVPAVAAPAHAAPVVLYEDSFSGAAVGWDASGSSSWVLQSGSVGASGQYAAAAPMPTGVNQIQQSISTDGYGDIQLDFRYAIPLAEPDSSLMVHYFTGSTWVAVGEYSAAIGWNTVAANLPASAADNPSFRLRVLVASTAISSDFLVLLDDVVVRGEPIPVDAAPPTVVSASPVSGATVSASATTTFEAVVADDLTAADDLIVDYTFSSGSSTWVFPRAFIGRVGGTATRDIPGWQIADELGLAPGDTFTWTVTVEDAVGSIANLAVTPITFTGETQLPPVLETTALPAAEVGVPYLVELAASGIGPFTWTSADPLPAGLALAADTGIISGTPTVATTVTTLWTVANDAGSDARSMALVTQVAPQITTAALPDAAVGAGYNYPIAASGSGPRTWSLVGALPPGMTFSSNTVQATIASAPTSDGVYTFTVRVENQVGVDEREFTIDVTTAVVPPNIVTTEIPDAVAGQPFAFAFEVEGTDPGFSLGAAPPDGLDFDTVTGVLSGVPTIPGDYTVWLFASKLPDEDDEMFPFTVLPAPTLEAPTITTATLPDAVVGFTYVHTLAADGTAPVTWSSSSLPDWLSLDAGTGELAGVPIDAGATSVTVTATNATGSDSQTLALTIGARPAILTSTLAAGTIGVLYSEALLGNGSLPWTWDDVEAPPAGLTLSGGGILSGTPTAIGTFSFDVSLSNPYGTATREVTLTIAPVAPVPPTITGVPGGATVGVPYVFAPTLGGTGPLAVALTSGSLPDGLTLDPATGAIEGIPADTAGSYPFQLAVTGAVGPVALLSGSLVVAAGEPVALHEVRTGLQSAAEGGMLAVDEGGSLAFQLLGVDPVGNLVDVTSDVEFVSDVPTDVVVGATIGFPTASPHAITATHLPTGWTFAFVVEVTPASSPTSVPTAALARTGSEPGSAPVALTALVLGGILLLGRVRAARRIRTRS